MKTFLEYLKEADEMEDQTSTEGKNGENSEYEEQLRMGIDDEIKDHQNVYKLFDDTFKENNIENPIDLETFAKMIAESHLKQFPTYYTDMKKYEEEKKESKSEEEME